jgi:hypothetical protein
MSLEKCTYFGAPAYRWGKDGKAYMYNPKTKGAKERAKALAEADGDIEKAKLKAEEKARKAAKKK